ncbi:MAG: hypothetical protein IAE99_13465 [Rhodothermales bacterium]|nr:hypothetical protein [Rhodothermales bacterium]
MKPALALAALGLAGCSLEPTPPVCTRLFAYVTVLVRDAAAHPVADASVDVIRVATGRSIVCAGDQTQNCVDPTAFFPEAGTYAVFHDGLVVSKAGEAFRVIATKGASRAEAVLRIGSDGCHVEKRSGPDVLTLAP